MGSWEWEASGLRLRHDAWLARDTERCAVHASAAHDLRYRGAVLYPLIQTRVMKTVASRFVVGMQKRLMS